MKLPLPRTPAQWLTEIKLAIADAAEAAPFGPLAGTEITPDNLFHLAPLVCLEIADVLLQLKENEGMTIVITEQNVNFALTLAEEIYLLETGHMKMRGKPEELKQETYIQETYFGS